MVPSITTFWLASLGFWSFQHQFSHIFFLWQPVNCCLRQKQKTPFTQSFGNIVTFSCQSTKWPQTISWGDSLIPGHISCDQLTAPPSTHSSFFLMIEASRELYVSYHQDCSFQELDIYICSWKGKFRNIFVEIKGHIQIFIRPRSDHSLRMSLTDELTDSRPLLKIEWIDLNM